MSFPLIFACWVVARALRHLGSDNPWIAIIDPFEIAVFGWLLLLIVRVPGGWISRVFGWQPLVFLGKISYGLFIWHMLVVCALNPHLTAVGLGDAVLIKATFFTVASVGIAWLSWIAIERPALAWASAWKLPASGVLPGLRALWARLSALVEGVRNFGRESV
jgi:peptidoglycan/LPS O-acetylase OafA/YrhL